jgi:hypothetical protein
MKRIYIPLALLLLSSTTFAQIKFAPEFGANVAMQTTRFASDTLLSTTQTSKPAPGLTIGLNLDIKILRNLYINTGAAYFFNNVKYQNNLDFSSKGLDVLQSERYDRVHYVRAPLYIMYKSGFEGMGRFTAGAGVYAAYAIGGNRVQTIPSAVYNADKQNYYAIYKHSNSEMSFGNDPKTDQMRRWDYGLNACIGYESNVGLYFRGWGNYGLVNLDPNQSDNLRVRNWGLGISIGFLIGKDNW